MVHTDVSTETSLAVVDALYTAAAAGKLDEVSRMLADDVVLYEAESLPYGGVHQGRDNVMKTITLLFTEYLNLSEYTVVRLLGEGEHVVACLKVAGVTHTSGKPVAFEACERFVVRDGVITEIKPFYWDTAALLEAYAT